MKKIFYIVLCIVIMSCGNDDYEDGLTMELGKCNFSDSTKIKKLKNKEGVLHYSKSVSGIPIIYYIKIDGELPLEICNMPSSFKMEEEGKSTVIFSGNMEVLGDRVDAISTRLELTKLKY